MARFDCQFGLTDIEEMSKTHMCVTVRVRSALSGRNKPVGWESEAEGEGSLPTHKGPKIHQVHLLQLPSSVGCELQLLCFSALTPVALQGVPRSSSLDQ